MNQADVAPTFGGTVAVNHEIGKAKVCGVDWGPKVEFHGMNKSHLVLKIGGHMAWSGRGATSYYSTRFSVYEIIEVTPPEKGSSWTTYKVKGITQFTMKKEK